MTDDGLLAATQRIMRLLGCYPDESGQCTALHDHDISHHAAEVLAKTAREDVDETVREARAAELDEACKTQREWAKEDYAHGIDGPARGRLLVAADLRERAAAIRAGEQ